MADAPKTGGIHAPVQPSPELGAIVGNDRLPRSQVISSAVPAASTVGTARARASAPADNAPSPTMIQPTAAEATRNTTSTSR